MKDATDSAFVCCCVCVCEGVNSIIAACTLECVVQVQVCSVPDVCYSFKQDVIETYRNMMSHKAA